MQTLTRYVCLLFGLTAIAAPESPLQLWLASFDQVWQTVSTKHWDAHHNGINWAAARTRFRPRVEAAQNETEARTAISEMLATLGHSHIGLIPANVYRDLAAGRGEGYSGLQFEILEGEAILTTPPYQGWVLRSVDSREVAPRIARAKSTFGAITAVENLLRGDIGESLPLVVEDLTGKLHAAQITLKQPPGRRVQFGELPALYLDLSWRRHHDNIAYLRISNFFDPEALNDLLKSATTDCHECTGFIIDLRGNTGGLGALAATVAGWFLAEPASLGTCFFRQGKIELRANPRSTTFAGPLAILINPTSLSTSEFLAKGLQDLHRARIFGQPSGGMALPSSIERLPMGDGFQYTTANYLSAGGQPIEGIGVQPDTLVQPTRQQLRDGQDPTLAAATLWIQNQGVKP